MEHENHLATSILDAAFRVHRAFGPGLLESAYETILAHEMGVAGLRFDRQTDIPLRHGDLHIPCAFKADFVVGGKVIIEVKSVERLAPVHKKQLLTYLRLAGLRLGLLVKFNEEFLKNGIVRVAN